MKRRLAGVGLVLCLGGCAALPQSGFRPYSHARTTVPPRVAVASFENRSGYEGKWKLGEGMADLLVAELMASGRFVVLERQALDTVVAELSRQGAGRFRAEGRVAEGRLENAQYLIRGVITDFSQTSAGSLWLTLRRWLIGSGGYRSRVGLTLTLIEVESGKVQGAVQCSGRARAGNAYAQGEYKDVQFGGSLFFQTPLGKATAAAIRDGLRKLQRNLPARRWRPMVAQADGTQVVLNGGRDRGIRAGQRYQARGGATAVTDPGTGEVLDLFPGAPVGVVEVVEVRERIALAVVRSGSGFARGQVLEALVEKQRENGP